MRRLNLHEVYIRFMLRYLRERVRLSVLYFPSTPLGWIPPTSQRCAHKNARHSPTPPTGPARLPKGCRSLSRPALAYAVCGCLAGPTLGYLRSLVLRLMPISLDKGQPYCGQEAQPTLPPWLRLHVGVHEHLLRPSPSAAGLWGNRLLGAPPQGAPPLPRLQLKRPAPSGAPRQGPRSPSRSLPGWGSAAPVPRVQDYSRCGGLCRSARSLPSRSGPRGPAGSEAARQAILASCSQ